MRSGNIQLTQGLGNPPDPGRFFQRPLPGVIVGGRFVIPTAPYQSRSAGLDRSWERLDADAARND